MKKITNLMARPFTLKGSETLVLEPKAEETVSDDVAESFGVFLYRLVQSGFVKVESAEGEDPENVQIEHKGGGRYRVLVDGIQVHDELLKKDEAEALAEEHK